MFEILPLTDEQKKRQEARKLIDRLTERRLKPTTETLRPLGNAA